MEISCGGKRFESKDPQVCRAVVELHRALTKQTSAMEGDVFCAIDYRLRGGDWMDRRYQANLSDPAVYQALSALLNQPGLGGNQLIPDRGEYGERFVGGYAESYVFGQEIELTADQSLALYRALEADSDAPVKPEDLSDYYREGVHLELVTERGSYSIDELPTSSVNTLALLREYGLLMDSDIKG